MASIQNLVVDSSVFLSSFLDEDTNNALSRRFFDSVKQKNIHIFIPILAVFEILHSYYKKGFSRKQTDMLYKTIIDWNIDDGLHFVNLEASFLAHFTANHHLFQLKTSDTVFAILAHKLKYPLISWDKQILNIQKKYAKTLTPDEFLFLNL